MGDDGVPDVVVPVGDYGYEARLDTGPTFGCVLFDPLLRGLILEELHQGEAPVAWEGPLKLTPYAEPKPSICVIGVTNPGESPPVTIATAEEYRAYFLCDPPPDWFDPVMTVPIADAPVPLRPPPYPEQLEPGVDAPLPPPFGSGT